MSKKVYEQHWLTVLKQVVEQPMQRSLQYSYNLNMNKGTIVYVLVRLEKDDYIGQYNYTTKNVYETTFRYYYPTELGHQVVVGLKA